MTTADQGDGTYRNPVLFADYSDPDAIRVGGEFYLVASSFQCAPGLPVLRSPDLVNWELIGHVFSAQSPVGHFSVPRPGEGAWAPALRHHDGKFWVFYPDPDFGLHVCTASDPAGPWSAPHCVKAGRGLIDPCPFWDEDGQGYLIHGWAKSRSGINNLLTLHRLSPDGCSVSDAGVVVIDANRLPGWDTLEGPKLYKRRGWYYVFAPAGGVATGYQAVFRSRTIGGPYENRILLDQGSTAINGPHQGAWVDTASGEDWFLHFQDRGPFGRVVHLQPMSWGADDWPVIGRDPAGRGRGEPVLAHAKPAVAAAGAPSAPPSSDEFSGPALGLQWQWQANPRTEWATLVSPADGRRRLRLSCVPAAGANHWASGALLLQKFLGPAFTATAALDFSSAASGETAGLIVFGNDYAWIGLCRTDRGWRLGLRRCERAADGTPEREVAGIDGDSGRVQLRVTVDEAARCRFSWSADGADFAEWGPEFTAVPGRWIGAKVGLFASGLRRGRAFAEASADEPADRGFAEFGWFRLTR